MPSPANQPSQSSANINQPAVFPPAKDCNLTALSLRDRLAGRDPVEVEIPQITARELTVLFEKLEIAFFELGYSATGRTRNEVTSDVLAALIEDLSASRVPNLEKIFNGVDSDNTLAVSSYREWLLGKDCEHLKGQIAEQIGCEIVCNDLGAALTGLVFYLKNPARSKGAPSLVITWDEETIATFPAHANKPLLIEALDEVFAGTQRLKYIRLEAQADLPPTIGALDDPHMAVRPEILLQALGANADEPIEMRAHEASLHLTGEVVPSFGITSAPSMTVERLFEFCQQALAEVEDGEYPLHFGELDGLLLAVGPKTTVETLRQDYEQLQALREQIRELQPSNALTAPTFVQVRNIKLTEAQDIAAICDVKVPAIVNSEIFSCLLDERCFDPETLFGLARSPKKMLVSECETLVLNGADDLNGDDIREISHSVEIWYPDDPCAPRLMISVQSLSDSEDAQDLDEGVEGLEEESDSDDAGTEEASQTPENELIESDLEEESGEDCSYEDRDETSELQEVGPIQRVTADALELFVAWPDTLWRLEANLALRRWQQVDDIGVALLQGPGISRGHQYFFDSDRPVTEDPAANELSVQRMAVARRKLVPMVARTAPGSQ